MAEQQTKPQTKKERSVSRAESIRSAYSSSGKPKTKIAARERGPGPGRYGLPSSFGYVDHDFTKHMKPAFTFGSRLENSMFASECSPGPKYPIATNYTRVGNDGTPKYSILGRQKDPNTFVTPSPYAYSPEKCHPQGERHAAVYSMGARTRYRKRDQQPAPNSYNLPALIGPQIINKQAAASYSMTGRPNVGSYLDDLHKTPGPGSHDAVHPDITADKKPLYSMLARNEMPGDTTNKPGPGAHYPERVTVNKRKYPSHSMGIRHSEFVCPLVVEVKD